MNRELLFLHGARYAVMQMLKDGQYFFSRQMEDGTCETVDFADICDYLFGKIEEHKEQTDE